MNALDSKSSDRRVPHANGRSRPPSVRSTLAPYKHRKVLVLGATGFIGSWVVRHLERAGARIHIAARVADRGSARPVIHSARVVPHAVDLTAPDAVARLFAEVQPAITFNLAAYGVRRAQRSREQSFMINDAVVGRVAQAMADCPARGWRGQRLVHVGSGLEYSDGTAVITETSQTQPMTLYGQSKLAGTCRLAEFCSEHDLAALTARLFMVYGPGEAPGRLLPTLIAAATDDTDDTEVLLSSGTQKRDFTYVGDAAAALLRLGLAELKPGEVVNVATGVMTSIRSFAEQAAEVLEILPSRLRFGAIDARAKEESSAVRASNERLYEITGWTPPTSVAEGIRRTAAFLKRPSQPPLPDV